MIRGTARKSVVVSFATLLWLLIASIPGTSGAQTESLDAALCRQAVEVKRWDDAMEACAQAISLDPADRSSKRHFARATFEAGEYEKAVPLWRELIDPANWDSQVREGLARSLWRMGRFAEAEKTLREAAAIDPEGSLVRFEVEFFLSFDRWSEAEGAARRAVERFPSRCEMAEDLGVALSGLERDEEAAGWFRRALFMGCPPLRWSQRGAVPSRVGRAGPLHDLLDPAALVIGLAVVPESEAVARLEVLRRVATRAELEGVAEVVVARSESRIRGSGLSILESFGAASLPNWRRIFTEGDLLLRRLAIRRLGESGDGAFAGLLEDAAREESLPRTANLARLALGRLLLSTHLDPVRAERVLEAIPEGDVSFPAAALLLAERAASRGDEAAELSWLERALGRDPRVDVDSSRLTRLCRAVTVDR